MEKLLLFIFFFYWVAVWPQKLLTLQDSVCPAIGWHTWRVHSRCAVALCFPWWLQRDILLYLQQSTFSALLLKMNGITRLPPQSVVTLSHLSLSTHGFSFYYFISCTVIAANVYSKSWPSPCSRAGRKLGYSCFIHFSWKLSAQATP